MAKEAWTKFKNFWKRFWFLIWKDDSIKGWVISIIVMFIFIKFIFFPILSVATGTVLPLAIVESCSMYHQGNLFSDYDDWWQRHQTKYTDLGLNKEQFRDFTLKNGFNKGDILFIIGEDPKNINIGDIIIFNANKQNPLIHRVIKKELNEQGKYIFSTIGDNNNGQLSVETAIHENQIIGKASFKLAPYVGWAKLIFFEPSRSPSERGSCREN
jgi:signal peptidase I